ncbi:phage tail sheath subtilisin-like domain-containing protein [Sorangium sp. So ce1024]|uniref:phage tail sheath subtilisin-like domain-containing protein n=1 Tax=unclassified Sorangium TaxID=2621164 RepID=UPI003F05D4AB
MAEYLAPGVYIEERPGPRVIEGVSTSTAGFVGMTERGPVGGPPILVTSFGEFQRKFGGYLTPKGEHGYLPLAIRHFFDNGGKRAFVARSFRWSDDNNKGADYRRLALGTGAVARLRGNVPRGADRVHLTSLRGYTAGTAGILPADPARTGEAAVPIAEVVDEAAGIVRISPLADRDLRADAAFVRLTETVGTGDATLYAREPGLWGEDVRVQIRPAGGPHVKAGPLEQGEGGLRLRVTSAATFYPGATIEIAVKGAPGTPGTRAPLARLAYATVRQVVGDTLVLVPPATPLDVGGAEVSAAVAEIEILVSWRTEVERFRGSWWYMNPDDPTPPLGMTPAQRDEFNTTRSAWWALEKRSRLVSLTPPWADPAEAATPDAPRTVPTYDPANPLASHPTTPTGAPERLRPATGAPGQADPTPTALDYVGEPAGARRTGIAALALEDDISLVVVPGVSSPSVQAALIQHAESSKYRVAVLDGPPDADIAEIRGHRGNFDSSHAALYYPWVEVLDPRTGATIPAPPSGIALGVYARNDAERGVHKAPANEVARGALGLAAQVSHGDQEILNPEGINALRDFRAQERGIRIWGARTLSSDPQWKYLNVRRLFVFIERSIDRGTQWVVFEPNGPDLWGQVKRTVETFLDGQWRAGALVGARAEEAYYVKVDRSTMSDDDIANGRLVCEIGISPSRPAEFVIFRIGQFTADAPAT